MRIRFPLTAVTLVVSLAVAACSSSGATTQPAKTPVPTLAAGPTPVVTPAPETIAPTAAATPTATESAVASIGPAASVAETVAPSGSPLPTVDLQCTFGYVVTKNPDKLTLSTDEPAFPPFWGGTAPAGSDWTLGYPPSGEGFEAAIAYAVADAMGFGTDRVDWVQQSAFGNAFKPGTKNFDFHLGQVSFSPKRAQAADLSDSYYDVNQALIALATNPIAQVTTIAGLKDFKLGAAGNTTSYGTITDVVQPTAAPQAFDDNDKAVRALKNKTVDGIITDLPSAFEIRDAELNGKGAIVGQFPTQGEQEHFSLVLEKGSAMTACVNEAIAVIKANGSWQKIYDEWLADKASAPVFQ
jgi:polar amino acid transport system substrate-binding protein